MSSWLTRFRPFLALRWRLTLATLRFLFSDPLLAALLVTSLLLSLAILSAPFFCSTEQCQVFLPWLSGIRLLLVVFLAPILTFIKLYELALPHWNHSLFFFDALVQGAVHQAEVDRLYNWSGTYLNINFGLLNGLLSTLTLILFWDLFLTVMLLGGLWVDPSRSLLAQPGGWATFNQLLIKQNRWLKATGVAAVVGTTLTVGSGVYNTRTANAITLEGQHLLHGDAQMNRQSAEQVAQMNRQSAEQVAQLNRQSAEQVAQLNRQSAERIQQSAERVAQMNLETERLKWERARWERETPPDGW